MTRTSDLVSISELSFPIADADAAALDAAHNLVRMTLSGCAAASYSLILPEGWVTEEDLGQQNDGIGQWMRIGIFADRVGPDATVVQVSMARIPFEIDVQEWLKEKAVDFKTELLYCAKQTFACGSVVDAGGICGTESQQYVMRMVAHADAARIFVVSAATPLFRYEEEQNNIAIATSSFQLLRPEGSTQLEQWLNTEGGDPSFRVAYPATWVSRPVDRVVPGKSAVDIVLSDSEQIYGCLRVKATDTSSVGETLPGEALRLAVEELAEGNISLAGIWMEDEDAGIRSAEGLILAYLALGRIGSQSAEIRFGLLKRGSLLFALTSISIQRAQNSVLWMRSKRAYEIALMTACPS
jgi:hypothetical protein